MGSTRVNTDWLWSDEANNNTNLHTSSSGFRHNLQHSPVSCTTKLSWSKPEARLGLPPAKGRKMAALIKKKNEILQREVIKMGFLVHFLMFHCNVQTTQRLQRLGELNLLPTPSSHKWIHSCINRLSEVKMNIYYVCAGWDTWTGVSWDTFSPTAAQTEYYKQKINISSRHYFVVILATQQQHSS